MYETEKSESCIHLSWTRFWHRRTVSHNCLPGYLLHVHIYSHIIIYWWRHCTCSLKYSLYWEKEDLLVASWCISVAAALCVSQQIFSEQVRKVLAFLTCITNRLPREAVESPSLEIFKPRLDAVLCSLLWVTLLGQGVWAGWPTEVPSNPDHPVILWLLLSHNCYTWKRLYRF